MHDVLGMRQTAYVKNTESVKEMFDDGELHCPMNSQGPAIVFASTGQQHSCLWMTHELLELMFKQ